MDLVFTVPTYIATLKMTFLTFLFGACSKNISFHLGKLKVFLVRVGNLPGTFKRLVVSMS
jgi:hypothetical protein